MSNVSTFSPQKLNFILSTLSSTVMNVETKTKNLTEIIINVTLPDYILNSTMSYPEEKKSPFFEDNFNVNTSKFSSESPLLATVSANSTYHYYGMRVVLPLSIILIIITVMAIVGNIMVILTILQHKSMRTRTNMFIVNLAVADILVAIFDMPFSIITLMKGDWIFGNGMCEFNGYTNALFMIASVHTLMYISIHKYISITKPFSQLMTPKRILMIIAVIWIWSNGYSAAGAFGWNKSVYKLGSTQCGPSYPDNTLKKTHSMFNTLFNLLLPFGVMSFCYFNIFRDIRQHMSRMRETTNVDAKNSLMQQKRISTTLFIVLLCFLLCWFPYLAYSTFAAFVKDKSKVPIIGNPLAYWCGYINSACNPVIYAFRSPSFRQGYYTIICGRKTNQFSSTGSCTQSASFRNRSFQRSLPQNDKTPATNGTGPGGEASTSKKRRPKRLISMNSWASIVVPTSPIRKTPTTKLVRQASIDVPETPTDPLLKSPLNRCRPEDAASKLSNVDEDSTEVDILMAADSTAIALSPIMEQNIEDAKR